MNGGRFALHELRPNVGILQQDHFALTMPETGMFNTGYWLMPVARLVEDYGLKHPELSLDLCESITQRNMQFDPILNNMKP